MIFRIISAAAVAASLSHMPAAGATFHAEYTFVGGEILTFDFEGDLRDDGDTIDVTSVTSFDFDNGQLSFASNGFLTGAGGSSEPRLSISGAVVSLFVLDQPTGNTALTINNQNNNEINLAIRFGPTVAREGFSADRWEVSGKGVPVNVIPLPAPAALLLAGLAGLAALRRYRTDLRPVNSV